jgi:primosomal protein N' (replication factor Y)
MFMLNQHNTENQSSIQVAEVIVEVPARQINRTFDYIIPAHLIKHVQEGSRVVVPFGPRKIQGHVLSLKQAENPSDKLKNVESVLDELAPLTKELIDLAKWMSQEYVCLLITALQALLPAVLKSKTTKVIQENKAGGMEVTYRVKDKVTKKQVSIVSPLSSVEELEAALTQLSARAIKQREIIQFLMAHHQSITLQELLNHCETTRASVKPLEEAGLLQIEQQEVSRDPYQDRNFKQTEPLSLTSEQEKAFQRIISTIDQEEYKTYLVHGVTGSGKTEIYLQTISYAINLGKEAIVLVPEISLTPQMVDRFKGRFGNQVAVIHSRLSSGERYDEWRKIRQGKVKVAIGARSALFAPFQHLGIIIIDEEHESSYKQEENPRYHARDIAIFRGQYHQVPVILGSATPSLESYARAQKGVYELLTLAERVQGRKLPTVEIIDMREELHDGNRSMFSRPLYQKIEERLERKEQMVLFLNRRGFSTFVMCRDCGFVLECPHCDISLTYHKINQTHRCHYCGYTEKIIHQCPECESEHIRFFGTGTQKVEEELHKHFPGIKVVRMDVDTTQRKGSHERLLQQFRDQKADCLLGTQMIAKGLDFEKVTLVGVIAADSLLHLPDFRSSEKTFQLLTQVSGRAGRHELPGEVVVQTYTPEHYSIQSASEHDYLGFYQQEMRHRHNRGYPPYYFISLITFVHEDLPFLVKACEQSVQWLKQHVSPNTIVLGPVASPIPRIKDRYRYQCMIKYRDEPNLGTLFHQLLEKHKVNMEKHDLQITIDKNPQMLM